MRPVASDQHLLGLIENLHRILAAPLTETERQDGWSEGGKQHWCLIVEKWISAIQTKHRAPAVPLNGKHLDQSGGANRGNLFDELETVSNQIVQYQKQYSFITRLSWITLTQVATVLVFILIIVCSVIGVVESYGI